MKKLLCCMTWVLLPFLVHAQSIPQWKVEDLERHLKTGQGLLVVNFYASFCQPCNEELPGMLEVWRGLNDSTVKFLIVSLDEPGMYPKKLAKFLKKKKINAPVVWLDMVDAVSFCPRIDARWSGSIPATLFLNKVTGYRKFIEDELGRDQFQIELIKALTALL